MLPIDLVFRGGMAAKRGGEGPPGGSEGGVGGPWGVGRRWCGASGQVEVGVWVEVEVGRDARRCIPPARDLCVL